jgi:putative membrane protein
MMQDLAHANASEIAAGKLAMEKSQNDQVKQYAQKLIDDHTQAQQELQKIADAKGVKLENEPDAKHKTMVKTMSALEGEKFDKMYLGQGGARDHKNTQQLLQKMQKQSKDKDLQALAQKIEPAVQQHLTMAQDLQSGKSSASGASGATSGGASGGRGGATSGASGGSPGSSSGTSGTSPGGAGASGSSGYSGGGSGMSGGSSGSSK